MATNCTSQIPSIPAHIELLDRQVVHTTTVNGHTLAFLDEGQGQPIILIHGFGGSMWQWEQQQKDLAEQYRVITVDMPGSGLSDKPGTNYSPTFMLHAMTQFMDNLGIHQATFIGNSLGAGVAIGMALHHPARVEKLILISGFPADVIESVASPSYKRFITLRPPIWLARFGLWLTGRWSTKKILTEIIYDPTHITDRVIERSYRNRQDPRFLPPLYSQIDYVQEWEEDFASRLNEISHPTFIIWGEHDQVFPATVGQRLHATIPHSHFLEVPKSGHIPQWERPEIVNPALLQFLQTN